VKQINKPFFILCGYGQTGRLLNKGLMQLGIQTVVIEKRAEPLYAAELEEFALPFVSLQSDATISENLITAGITKPECQGVISLTPHDHRNLQIAVSAKLIRPSTQAICRAVNPDEESNMRSFNTDHVINPNRIFAHSLQLLLYDPNAYQIRHWLIHQHIDQKPDATHIPDGPWILVGYNTMSEEIIRALRNHGVEDITVVDASAEIHQTDLNVVNDRGTESKALRTARIDQAAVIVASSLDDANNLSTLITAKQLNPKLFTIGRVNNESNAELFKHAQCNIIMRANQIIANSALTAISRPLVSQFLKLLRGLNLHETEQLAQRLRIIAEGDQLVTRRFVLSKSATPSLIKLLNKKKQSEDVLTIADLDQMSSFKTANSLLLLHQNEQGLTLLPDIHTKLNENDELLYCCRQSGRLLIELVSNNDEKLDDVFNDNSHHIPLLRWWARRKKP
jgi:Trk K+ transport system NAD-binding subunit